jgi:hypothetical protein
MIKQFMSLIMIITVLWNRKWVQRVGKWLAVEMDMEMNLVS